MADDVAALIDRRAASEGLRFYTARLCSLLRQRPDRDAPAIGSWSLGDVANHVCWGIQNYARWLSGKEAADLDAIRNMSQWNIETVQKLPPVDLPEVADRIEVATDEFIRSADDRPASSGVRWYAGNHIPVEVAVCMRLIEAAVHGLDIAAAARRRWEIEPDHARTMSYGLGYIGPHFVDEQRLGFEGTIRMRIRGGADLFYIVRQRRLRVATTGPRPNWNLWVDPVAWVLVSTERANQWIAALRGKVIGWGLHPRLPFQLRAATFQG